MTYLATVMLDYNQPRSNEQTRLLNAHEQAGWDYADTSALVYESDTLGGFRLALEVLARTIETPGELSALAIQVQLVGFARPARAAVNHRRALVNLLSEPLPSSWR